MLLYEDFSLMFVLIRVMFASTQRPTVGDWKAFCSSQGILLRSVIISLYVLAAIGSQK